MIEGCGIERDLKLARLGHERLLLQLTTSPRLPRTETLHWEICLSFSFRMPVLLRPSVSLKHTVDCALLAIPLEVRFDLCGKLNLMIC